MPLIMCECLLGPLSGKTMADRHRTDWRWVCPAVAQTPLHQVRLPRTDGKHNGSTNPAHRVRYARP
jgi:hypothetical protein